MPVDEAKIGELIGTVSGLTKAFESMQKSQQDNRNEVIDIFKEMRDNVKEVAVAMAAHIKEDNIAHGQVDSLIDWRDANERYINTMWDDRNKATGILSASRLAGGAIWAVIALVAGYFMPHKF